MGRTIQDKEPERPSTKLSTMAEGELTITAKRHHTEAPKLISSVRGDLDWIVMKCLEKDRARRYETTNGLATDIQRHLNNEPVVACPPSNLYRFQKMVRRNKVVFSSAASVAAALLIGLGVSTWMFFREREARREQGRLRQQSEAKEKKTQQVAQFLQDMLKGVGPEVALGRDTTILKEILDKTAMRVTKDLTNQPEVEAELRNTIGIVYLKLARYAEAETIFREALQRCRKMPGNENPEVAHVLDNLASVLSARGELLEAETTQREALLMRRKLLGSQHPDVASSLNNLALVLQKQGGQGEVSVKRSEHWPFAPTPALSPSDGARETPVPTFAWSAALVYSIPRPSQ